MRGGKRCIPEVRTGQVGLLEVRVAAAARSKCASGYCRPRSAGLFEVTGVGLDVRPVHSQQLHPTGRTPTGKIP
jgi:hypothetical protein